MFFRLIPAVIASLLLSAHFLRGGNLLLTLLIFLLPLLLLIRKRKSLLVLQISSYLASVVWFYTAISIIQERIIVGKSWNAAAIILFSVASFSIIAGLFLKSSAVKEKYPD